ncbi:MAG TPA: DUF1552 domain-containing protein [Polyangiaceae bacterium]|jgi:hypothetical protein|nr:DUF1552 domain-containing protein [Polyangiaceae bacterium]
MISRRLSRRTLLRGAGGIAIGLPFLEIMARSGRAKADPQSIPQRFVVFFSPNGNIRENWTPTGTETDFKLSTILAPLAPFQDKLIVFDGIDNEAAKHGVGDDHMRGMGTMLTGTELLSGTTQGGCCEPAGLAGGVSVDQKIAQKIGSTTKFSSVEFGVQAKSSGTVWGYTAYSDSNVPLPPENNPTNVFNRVFADVGANQSALAKIAAERKSVLDAVSASYSALSPKLGATDKQKVDLHLSQIRDLETRLTATTDVGASCVKPTSPTIDFNNNDKFPDVGKLQIDLMVMALACDLTRVASIQWENSVGGTRFSWLGMDRGHHDMSHDGDDNTDTVSKLTQINTWYSQQLAYMMTAMSKIPEGSGTMLDHTLIFWVNELSRGNVHSHPNMPFLLAGGTAAAPQPLTMGRFLQYPDSPTIKHNDLMVSLLNVFGIPDKTFGNPAYCSGPLAKL